MLYNYYFHVAALIAGLFILIVYSVRRTLRTKSNKILFVLLVCNILAAASGIISSFCISYPDKYPTLLRYISAYGYLLFYNWTGLFFFCYVDSKTKIPSFYKVATYYRNIVMVLDVVLIFSSPFTHAVAYFDENNNYQHGPFMFFLYFIVCMNMVLSIGVFVCRLRRFNRYQTVSFAILALVVMTGVGVQALVPRLLVGQFACTLVLFFIYNSFENPVYFTYKTTTCYNRMAFLEIIKLRLRDKEDISLYTFALNDYENVKEALDLKNLERLSCTCAEMISDAFPLRSFCITDNKFAILLKNDEEEQTVDEVIKKFFSRDINLVTTKVKISVTKAVIKHIDEALTPEMVEDGVIHVLKLGVSYDAEAAFYSIIEKRKRARNISRILKDAIRNNDFDIFYQPIFNTAKGRFESAEALVRLRSNEMGYVSPEEFIPIAEKEGLITSIGDIVFKKVCRFIHDERVVTAYGIKYIEINLSPIQCIEEDIVNRYRDIMVENNVVPFSINFEITETAEIEKNEYMRKNIIKFHNMGIEFSIDDYGSGFASADYLFRLPVDIVKIDKSILWQSMKNANAGIVLIGTLRLLKDLGKKIVVEGVETEEMEKLLIDNGVDFLQGYYFSKPVPEKEFLEFLMRNNS